MKVYHIAALALVVLGNRLDGQLTANWKIAGISLTADTDATHRLPDGTSPNNLTIVATNQATGSQLTISNCVRLTTVTDAFIRDTRIAVLGRAGRASAVVIFDITQRRLSDWFFCIQPRRVSDNWIVYVESYPSHLYGANPQEVVLIYDLSRSPAKNRLPSAAKLPIPAPVLLSPTQVGTPIYPESNVREQSYTDIVPEESTPETVQTFLPFLMLSGQRLLFMATRGKDFPSSADYLIVVNLSHRIDRPSIQALDIPKDQLKKPGENPNFIQVTGIEAASPDSVRLFVPRSEYGVSSINVSIP